MLSNSSDKQVYKERVPEYEDAIVCEAEIEIELTGWAKWYWC